MLPRQQLLDLGLAPDLVSLRRQLVAAAERFDFALVNATLIRGDLRSRRAWVEGVDNTPAAYLTAQRDWDDSLRDPVLAALQAGNAQVLYDQSTYVGAGTADLWEAQSPFGYKAGISISMHEPSHLETFIFGMDGPRTLPGEHVDRVRLTAFSQLLAVHARSAMVRLLTPEPTGAPAVDSEELDCLRWAKDGYSVAMVADKLVISNNDVQRRLASAARKLNVRSTPEAVLRCIDGGLIDR